MATPSLSNDKRSDSQSTPDDTRALAASVVPHLHVDPIVRDEQIPLFREVADPLRPELDRVVAANALEVVAVFGEVVSPMSRRRDAASLLRDDVAADALGPLVRAGGGRFHDDREAVIPSARTSISVSS